MSNPPTRSAFRWKFWLLGLLSLLLAIWVCGTSESFQNCIHQRKNDKTYSALRESSSVVRRTVVRVALHQTCVGYFTDQNQGPITALATVVVAIFTLRLWRSTEKLWGVAEEQRKDTQRSIRAAEDAAVTARTTLENTARAFVDFDDPVEGYSAGAEGLTHIHFFPTIVNNGSTTTQNGFTMTSWIFQNTEIMDDFEFPDIIRAQKVAGPQRLSVPPRGNRRGPPAIVQLHQVINALQRKGHIYFWGWVEYDDVVPKTPRHRTEFAGEVTITRDPRIAPPPMFPLVPFFKFRFLNSHNGADRDCYYQPRDPRPSYKAHNGPRQDLPPDAPENRGATESP